MKEVDERERLNGAWVGGLNEENGWRNRQSNGSSSQVRRVKWLSEWKMQIKSEMGAVIGVIHKQFPLLLFFFVKF